MEGAHQLNTWDGYGDWRNRPAYRGRHGGMLAASFVLVVEVLENLAYLANASNLVLYLREYMNLSPSKSANSVTNFMGSAFLLALLGGFLSDAFCTSYLIFLISALIEFLGLVVLTVQAHLQSLKPPACINRDRSKIACQEVNGAQAAILYIGLYLVALGVGGIKGSLPAHGAEQFDESSPKGRKHRSTFFTYFVFCLSCGALVAVTFVVWIEDNKGWEWGFGISTLVIVLSIPIFLAGSATYRNKLPFGSPLTVISKVLVAAVINNWINRSSSNAIVNMVTSPSFSEQATKEPTEHSQTQTESLNFLDKAVINTPFHCSLSCTRQQVEEVKIVLKLLPIFACTIMLNCCLAQLSTFSVQQAATMNRNLGSINIPPASLPVFPVLFIMILAPIYTHFIIPLARKVTQSETGITHLQRIGLGLFLSIIAMGMAAVVEIERIKVASKQGLQSTNPLPITFFWIAFQYLFLGSADLFTLAGLLEFFFTEAPTSMRSLATALSWASLAIGYYLSSAIVAIVNRVTSLSGNSPWLSGDNLNNYHLHRFYWLLCVLSVVNFMNYIFWSTRYKYRSTAADK